MASNNATQYEAEHGTSLENDLASILAGSQNADAPLQTPKRKDPPEAVESVNSSAPRTISSTDPIDEEILLVTGAASTTINTAGDGPQQFQLSPRPQVVKKRC